MTELHVLLKVIKEIYGVRTFVTLYTINHRIYQKYTV
jgi:hypothetical protein